jgi:hypothetical protein
VKVAAGIAIDPTLAQVVTAWSDAGYWANAVDDQWRNVMLSDELASVASDQFAMGEFFFGPLHIAVGLRGRSGHNSAEEKRTEFVRYGGWLLSDIAGGRDALRAIVDPIVVDLVDDLEPCDAAMISYDMHTQAFGSGVGASMVVQRVRDTSGRTVGTVSSSSRLSG